MGTRWLKLFFFLALGLVIWIGASAFYPHAESDSIAATDKGSIEQSIPPVTTPPNSVPVAHKDKPTIESATPRKDDKKAVAGKLSATADAADPSAHSAHKKIIEAYTNAPRQPVDPKKPIARDGYGTPQLDWDILGATLLDENLKPTFLKKLSDVNGVKVTLTGFMHPLDEVGEMNSFLFMEYPIGCFYCLVPSPTALVHVQLADGKKHEQVRELVKITGKLKLNAENPEEFIFVIRDADISLAE